MSGEQEHQLVGSDCICGWRADMSDAAYDLPSVQWMGHLRDDPTTQPDPGTADVEALLAEVLAEHADCTLNSDNSDLGAGVTGVDSWSCGIRLPFNDDLEAAERAHVASAQAAALAGMLPVTAPGSSNLQQTLEQAEAALAAERARVADAWDEGAEAGFDSHAPDDLTDVQARNPYRDSATGGGA